MVPKKQLLIPPVVDALIEREIFQVLFQTSDLLSAWSSWFAVLYRSFKRCVTLYRMSMSFPKET